MFLRTAYRSFQATKRFLKTSCIIMSSNVQDLRPLKAIPDEKSLTVHWEDTTKSKFHHVWLRHHCQCIHCLNPDTHQRTVDMALIPSHISPQDVETKSTQVQIKWSDGHHSCFESSWLKRNAYDGQQQCTQSGLGSMLDESDMVLWNKNIITPNPPPDFHFDEVQADPSVLASLLVNLHRYGFIFIDGTPLDDECVPSLCETIGGFVLQTVFGRVYKIGNTGMTHADIAYFNPALNAHSGHAYFTTPAGLQALHVTYHDGTGGETLLVDGFKAAKILHQEDPQSYEVLTSTYLPFEYIGNIWGLKLQSVRI